MLRYPDVFLKATWAKLGMTTASMVEYITQVGKVLLKCNPHYLPRLNLLILDARS